MPPFIKMLREQGAAVLRSALNKIFNIKGPLEWDRFQICRFEMFFFEQWFKMLIVV